DDMAVKHDFGSDPYLKGSTVRSMMLCPVQLQGKTTAVIFLENNVTSHVFTRDRMDMVRLLGSQAAISLENASHYESLEKTIAERTAELRTSHEKIIKLQRETTQMQMAGGFAHEMRNALSGAYYSSETLVAKDGALADIKAEMTKLSDQLGALPESERDA